MSTPFCKYILTNTSNAKSFRNIILINKRGLAQIIVPFRGYDRHSPYQVMIRREWMNDKVLHSFLNTYFSFLLNRVTMDEIIYGIFKA